MLQPAISMAGARPWARAKAVVARTTQPAPSETTNPRRSIEKGRLARAGGSSACPGLGLVGAVHGGEAGHDRLDQREIDRAADGDIGPARLEQHARRRSWRCTPVAQAVIVAVIGPVAPVSMETLPPTMLMQELGLV